MYLSFSWLEKVCCDPWAMVDKRPKAICQLEKLGFLSTRKIDRWAITHCNDIIVSIRSGALEAARTAHREYRDVSPRLSLEPLPDNEAHTGVSWDTQAINVPESSLDLAIANRLAANVGEIVLAKDNRECRKKRK